MALYVIAGHGAGDPGASGGGYNEADLTRSLAWAMGAIPGCDELDTSRNWYADGGIYDLGWMQPEDCLIELHLDCYNGSACGGHVIISDQFEPDQYDNAIAEFLGSYFPGRSNLVVKRGDLANPSRAAEMGINYRLVEVCFIDNDSDRSKFLSNVPYIAEKLCACFGLSKPATTPVQAPEPEPEPVAEVPESAQEPISEPISEKVEESPAHQETEPQDASKVETKTNVQESLSGIIRLLAALILPYLTAAGISLDADTLIVGISALVSVGAVLWAWWKNNNMTKAAQAAQIALNESKAA